jgi:hypothetical protein
MILLVNGFICTNSTEVFEALLGEQPPAKPGELPYSSRKDDKISAYAGQPATVLSGALKDVVSPEAVTLATASDASMQAGAGAPQPSIDQQI